MHSWENSTTVCKATRHKHSCSSRGSAQYKLSRLDNRKRQDNKNRKVSQWFPIHNNNHGSPFDRPLAMPCHATLWPQPTSRRKHASRAPRASKNHSPMKRPQHTVHGKDHAQCTCKNHMQDSHKKLRRLTATHTNSKTPRVGTCSVKPPWQEPEQPCQHACTRRRNETKGDSNRQPTQRPRGPSNTTGLRSRVRVSTRVPLLRIVGSSPGEGAFRAWPGMTNTLKP